MMEAPKQEISNKYDFLFIGLGAANCLLILRLFDEGMLTNKTIAIIEPSSKTQNDRTFCFWATPQELVNLKLENLVSYKWDTIEIVGITKQKIAPLEYFHVSGLDLYNQSKLVLANTNVTFFASVLTKDPLKILNYFQLSIQNQTICAHKVFDSRPPVFLQPQKNQSHLLQSFYGFKIKSIENSFDPSVMVMMDFNVPQNNFTQFVYVLPYDEQTALIELTRFGEKKLEADDAKVVLQQYIEKLNFSFEVLDIEQGVIPMSSAPIQQDFFCENWISMGAKANMLKSTTGYAFHAMAEDALVQSEAIKNQQIAKRETPKKRFVFYDRLLLKILSESPENGKKIFEMLFKNVPAIQVLVFLREKTNTYNEISIFSKLPISLFLKVALKDTIFRLSTVPVVIWPFFFTIFALLALKYNFQYITFTILAIGFLSIGLSHGALDHLTSKVINNKKQLVYFVLEYLLKGILLGLLWFVFPDLALFFFIAYSAWHFGQADFIEWKLKQNGHSFLWGLVVLFSILFFHFGELEYVLGQIPNLQISRLVGKVSSVQLIVLQVLMVFVGLLLAIQNKSKFIFFTLFYLLLSSFLPLLTSFGIYFVFQHSIHGWLHLSSGLNKKSSTLWLNSLPFSIGGALLILLFILSSDSKYVGIFFILLSCLSLPHVLSMHSFYRSSK